MVSEQIKNIGNFLVGIILAILIMNEISTYQNNAQYCSINTTLTPHLQNNQNAEYYYKQTQKTGIKQGTIINCEWNNTKYLQTHKGIINITIIILLTTFTILFLKPTKKQNEKE